jgi:hypothetical protein
VQEHCLEEGSFIAAKVSVISFCFSSHRLSMFSRILHFLFGSRIELITHQTMAVKKTMNVIFTFYFLCCAIFFFFRMIFTSALKMLFSNITPLDPCFISHNNYRVLQLVAEDLGK